MKISLCVVGRLRTGPERTLITDYLGRFDKTGRALALGPATVVEVEDRKNGGPQAEAILLDRACPDGAVRVVLDERGRTLTSPDFARHLADWRDQGRASVAFCIGGADGLDPGFRDKSDMALSFGSMVWPHMLARVMLAEQLYRASAILAGTPYHRA